MPQEDATKRLLARCLEENIETEQVELEPDDQEKGAETAVVVKIPEGRGSRSLTVVGESAERLLKTEFNRFRFLKGYEAIWSPSLKVIEAEITSGGVAVGPSTFVLRRLRSALGDSVDSPASAAEETKRIPVPSPGAGIEASIGLSSEDHLVLCSLRDFGPPRYRPYRRFRPQATLRLEGVVVDSSEQAVEIMEKVANSIFFQIDLAVEMPFFLAADRAFHWEIRRRRRGDRPVDFAAPLFEYASDAMALYWYARSSFGMPLLQFLAYYQVLEFFFPRYSEQEAQQRIRNLLKDPRFSLDDSSDIAKIIGVVRAGPGGRGFGDERSQLEATIRGCVTSSDLEQHVSEDPERREFFAGKRAQGLSDQRILTSGRGDDIRSEATQRVYDIRCRIVHTKGPGASQDLLLPFSPEVRTIRYDLDLVEFLARKVLIAESRPLRVHH